MCLKILSFNFEYEVYIIFISRLKILASFSISFVIDKTANMTN